MTAMSPTQPSTDPAERLYEAIVRFGATPFESDRWEAAKNEVAAAGAVFNRSVTSTAKAPLVAANDNRPLIRATSWDFMDPASIPPREWLYGHHYIRRFISVTVSPGGVGKTSKAIGEALSMATGRPLLGETVHQRARVWMWNGEDPKDELDRRIAAACIYYGVTREELAGWLFVDSGREQQIVTATTTKDGTKIAQPLMAEMIDVISRNSIDVVIIDPFVSSHAISENDNMAMDQMLKQFWAPVIDQTNCSVELIHHAKKLGGTAVTAESARGAVALIGAARSAIALNPMSVDEANKANVENRHLYFRAVDAKANMAPASGKSSWFRLESVNLGNSTRERPSDHVGVVTPWKWPDAMAGLTVGDLIAVQRKVAAGRWRDSSQAKEWVGNAVADALDLNLDDDVAKAKVKELLRIWKGSGALKVDNLECEDRKKRPHVVVGEWATEGADD
jgi:hypothetical protein